MSSPKDSNIDTTLGSIPKEQKNAAKIPSRFNLESQLFQDTYEVEFSSKNVQSSVEDWIEGPSTDFTSESQSGKYTSLDSASAKHALALPHRDLTAYGSFYQQSGSNYSLGSQLTDTSGISGVSHHNPHNP